MAVVSSTSDPQLLVHCETWLEFIERYASDLRTGGLYVATDDPPPVLTALDVRLQLPEATELLLRARVVQVLSDEQARAVGKARGVGLELADMDPDRKRQIAQLLEFARWQGEQNDPNASFTRMLLEMSPSLPAAEVGCRLSLARRHPTQQRQSHIRRGTAGGQHQLHQRHPRARGAQGRTDQPTTHEGGERPPDESSASGRGRTCHGEATGTRSAAPTERSAAGQAPAERVRPQALRSRAAHLARDAREQSRRSASAALAAHVRRAARARPQRRSGSCGALRARAAA